MGILLLVVICSFFTCIIIYKWCSNSSNYKGKIGESRVHDILMHLSDDYIILDNVVLFTTNGTTQIDHIVVSKYGVFTIETKNYRGDIYGCDNQEEWTQIIVTHVRYRKNPFKEYTYVTNNKMYNPVKQSIGHSYVIKDKLKSWKHLPIVPIVCFIGDANISNVKSNHNVVGSRYLLSVFDNYKTTYLKDEEVKEIAQLLSDYNMRSEVSMKSHINNIATSKKIKADTIKAGMCPKCGGILVERQGKYGNFLGCSNYPKCKFTKPL